MRPPVGAALLMFILGNCRQAFKLGCASVVQLRAIPKSAVELRAEMLTTCPSGGV
jgi:hypothetical protein